jgi:hypothetical protein
MARTYQKGGNLAAHADDRQAIDRQIRPLLLIGERKSSDSQEILQLEMREFIMTRFSIDYCHFSSCCGCAVLYHQLSLIIFKHGLRPAKRIVS